MSQIVKADEAFRSVRDFLSADGIKRQLAMVAPKHITPDRIIRIALSQLRRTPKLMDCSKESLFGCILTSTQIGLEPDGVRGLAYLIPFGRECTLIVGYKGLMDLARRSAEIASIEAEVVYEGDRFEFHKGTDSKITHTWDLSSPRKNPIGAYCIAKLANGGQQFEVMTKSQIEEIRGRSRASNSGPWVTDWAEMAKKTVVRRLCKYLPSSPELQQAVSIDEAGDIGLPQSIDIVDEIPDTPPALPPTNGKTHKAAATKTTATKAKETPIEDTPSPNEQPEDGDPGDSPAGEVMGLNAANLFLKVPAADKAHLKEKYGFASSDEFRTWKTRDLNDLMTEMKDLAK